LSADRIEQFAKAIESVEEILFVAEVQSLIAGFASIVPKSSELRAVYVDPKFGRRGVGKALLARVESEARERGLIRLTMNASLSAEEFYLSQGYVELERIDHTLKSGSQMPAIKMAKALA
jgi:ribosomal protein S18 acetylase RimI-like enzyme